MKRIVSLFSVGVGVVFAVHAQASFSFTSFGPSSWGVDDATLGVSGYVIEDFEDTTLVTGLTYSVFSPNGNLVNSSVLPNTFKPSDDAFGSAFTFGGGGVWDGSHGVINTRTNQTFSYSETGSWGQIQFDFAGGARSVGISLQQVDLDGIIEINGTAVGSLSSLTTLPINGQRQGYLRIDASSGDVINSLKFINGNNGNFSDGVMYDHLAFDPVPEPATLVVAGAGLAACLRRRKTRTA